MSAHVFEPNRPQFRILSDKKIIELLTHNPKSLPEELFRELKKVEKTWFDSVGLKHEYHKRG